MSVNYTLVSIVLFQVVWLLCVLAGSPWFLISLPILALYFAISPSAKPDAIAMLVMATAGIAFDFSLYQLGFYDFNSGPFPLWLVVLWCAFGATFYNCFGWLTKQAVAIQALLGGIGGPLSYFAGMRASAVIFPEPLVYTLGLLSFFWAAFFVAACSIKRSRFTYAHPLNT